MTAEELKQNKLELLGKLVAGLGHEIRNPLSAIKLNLDYMEMFMDEMPQDINESVQSCKDGLERIEHLITTILYFVKNKADEDKIPIQTIVDDAVNLSMIKARGCGVKIESLFDSSLNIYLYPRKILQVLLNLISNAIEACHSGGKVIIGSEVNSESSHFCLYVEDNGEGIPEDRIEEIFDEFYTTKEKGTGLGLYVCRNLLEDYNALLKVESTYGSETKFYIEFLEEN
jgi:signal transduction histidine kinase